jgi:hypothetical protein
VELEAAGLTGVRSGTLLGVEVDGEAGEFCPCQLSGFLLLSGKDTKKVNHRKEPEFVNV